MPCTKLHTYLKFDSLKDHRAVTIIDARIRRLAVGHIGDVKSLGDRVSELRIHYGPGSRLYFTKRSERIVLLLCGGVKKRQDADIAHAKLLKREIGNDS